MNLNRSAVEKRVARSEKVFFPPLLRPLDNSPEEILDTEHLGPMRMTRTVRICLFALRGHLIRTFGLLDCRVCNWPDGPPIGLVRKNTKGRGTMTFYRLIIVGGMLLVLVVRPMLRFRPATP